MAKTTAQFEAKASDIRRSYRHVWANSRTFRMADDAVRVPPGPSASPDSIAFSASLFTFWQHCNEETEEYVNTNRNLLAGLVGFAAGLSNKDNVAMLRYDWCTSERAGKRAALHNYLYRAGETGMDAGVVHAAAWAAVDVMLVNSWSHLRRRLSQLFKSDRKRAMVRIAVGLCAVTCIKLGFDFFLFMDGGSLTHPFSRENLMATGANEGLAAVFMSVLSARPASIIFSFVVGLFVHAYIKRVTTEATETEEPRLNVMRRHLLQLVAKDPADEFMRWVVPDHVSETIPSNMICMISTELFMEPVLLHDTVFEKQPLLRWIRETGKHPLNGDMQVSLSEVMPAQDMRVLCHELAKQHNLEKHRAVS